MGEDSWFAGSLGLVFVKATYLFYIPQYFLDSSTRLVVKTHSAHQLHHTAQRMDNPSAAPVSASYAGDHSHAIFGSAFKVISAFDVVLQIYIVFLIRRVAASPLGVYRRFLLMSTVRQTRFPMAMDMRIGYQWVGSMKEAGVIQGGTCQHRMSAFPHPFIELKNRTLC